MKKTLAIEFLLVAVPKVLNGAGLVLINVLAQQVLSPAAFGVFYLCSMTVVLVDGVVGSAFDMGVVRLVPNLVDRDPARARAFESAALALKFFFVALATIAVIPLAGTIADKVFQQPGRQDLIYLTCAAAIALLALRSVQVHLQVANRFATYGVFDLLASVLRIGGAIFVLYVWLPDPGNLLAALALAPAIAFAIGIATVGRELIRYLPDIGSVSVDLMAFVKWPLFTFCITTIAARIDLFLLAAWTDMTSVGLFSAGQMLTMIPELLGMYLAIIVSPKIMPAIKAGSFPGMFRHFQAAALVAAAIGLLICLAGIGLFGDYILAGNYQRSAVILAILLPGALLSMANFPLVVPALMFLRPSALLKIELTLLPPLIILYYLAIQSYGAEGAAVVTTCGRTLKAVIQMVWTWRCSNQPLTIE